MSIKMSILFYFIFYSQDIRFGEVPSDLVSEMEDRRQELIGNSFSARFLSHFRLMLTLFHPPREL